MLLGNSLHKISGSSVSMLICSIQIPPAALAGALAHLVVVPEPATITMLGAGLAGLVFWKRRKNQD